MRYRASERRKLALNRLCTFVTALMVVGCDLLPRSPSIQIEALKGRILFVSHHSGNFDIYRINADGSDPGHRMASALPSRPVISATTISISSTWTALV